MIGLMYGDKANMELFWAGMSASVREGVGRNG
jgi:hypothetical protein